LILVKCFLIFVLSKSKALAHIILLHMMAVIA